MAQVNWYSGVIECYRHKHVTLSRLSIYWALDACSSLCQAYYMLFRMSCVIAVIICFIDEETVKLYFCQTKWQNQDSDSGLAEFSWKFLTKISEHWLKLSDLAGIYTHPTCFAKCSCKVFYSKRVHCSMPQTLKQFLSRHLETFDDYRLVVLQTVPQCGFVSLWFHRGSVSLAERSQKWHVLRKTWVPVGWWPNQRFFCFIFRWNLGKTYNIVLGSGQVVLGMDMGLREMCVGEKRTVIIPPHLGYGEAGVGESVTVVKGIWDMVIVCILCFLRF